ncbi:MAG: ADP-ribose diphosphatase [Rhodospirillaceae bacterium]|nr:ADP-ribose diphosphatase [Rhodospirillaceae bacterium]MBT3629673.1 ADP-ribose diphosphatase [Rhodospirillaceae bacterium]MBT3928445.1 ADP-ribose diphosphatase [Rhodospirillaceae bacterium]MBT4425997.1 ADP-ribose diphosphatase [Rhodospirillaceae bacterium]MBT5780562.1 ADP-ribose diphosphatase [Rhodospirillaceae bacterium]
MNETPNEYEILERKTPFQGYFRIDKYKLRHRRFAGGWTEPFYREVFERGHAAAVLPYDPLRDEVVMQEQFRIGALEAPGSPWLLEIVAGIIDAGESAEEVARREAVEEAGLQLQDIHHIQDYLASPGGTTERVSLFVGRVDSSNAGGIFGLAVEAEDIRVRVLPFEQAMAELAGRPINVASIVIAMQWLALNRDMLRQIWSEAPAL